MKTVAAGWLGFGALALLSCNVIATRGTEDNGGTGRVPDSGVESGLDAGADAGSDAGRHTGPDAGPDAGSDAGSDAGPNTGPDAGSDGGTDAGGTTGSDAGECSDRPSDLAVVSWFPAPEFYCATSGDLNGDGLLDMVGGSLDPNQGVEVLYGLADGGLSAPIALETGVSQGVGVAIGDIDGDGLPDVAAVGDGFLLFYNDGDGGFDTVTRSQPFDGGLYLYEIGFGDFDGDGASDLVASGFDQDTGEVVIEILRSQGARAFTDPVPVPGIGGVWFLVADLNRDGLSDLVATSADGAHLAVLLSTQDGGFITTVYPFQFQGWPVSILDYGRGSAPNLVAAIASDGGEPFGMWVLLNSGAGTFTVGSHVSTEAGLSVVGDFNGDCVPDVALFSGDACDGPDPTLILIAYGRSDGTFFPEQSLDAGSLIPFAMTLLGPTDDPRALGFATPCISEAAIYGDASR